MKTSPVLGVASAAFFVACWIFLSAQFGGRPAGHVIPENFGGGCGVSDNGPAIQAAIDSTTGKTVVDLSGCVYRVVTPITTTKLSVSIVGVGSYVTFLDFEPSANGTLLKFGSSGGETASYTIKDLGFYSTDTAKIKTALNIVDASDVLVFNISCGGQPFSGNAWHDTTLGSICLQTNGHDLSTFEQLYFLADKPVVIADNPSSFLSADHYVFRDLYLAGNGGPCISANAPLTSTSFVGRQSYAVCAGGFKAGPSTLYPTSTWNNLTLDHLRSEQNVTAPDIDINPGASTNLYGLAINNSAFGMAGIKLRRVQNAIITNPVAACGVAQVLDIDTSSLQIQIINARFEAACTASLGGMIASNVTINPSGSTVPSSVTYLSAARGIIELAPLAFASLPTCNAAAKGSRGFITDGNSATYRTASAGGGATNIGVLCDGTNWLND